MIGELHWEDFVELNARVFDGLEVFMGTLGFVKCVIQREWVEWP